MLEYFRNRFSRSGGSCIDSRCTAELQLPKSGKSFEKLRSFERIYAIGDIHGQFSLFRDALAKIQEDNSRRSPTPTVIILLGDLIDRGPESREVLNLLQSFHTRNSGLVVLRGNHEALLLDSADGDPASQEVWMRMGGRETLESYDVDLRGFAAASPSDRAMSIRSAVGESTLDWLRSRPLSYRSGDFFFCHAGIRPGVELNKQREQDLLWIRKAFLQSDLDHGAVVVHGHTEVDHPEFLHNRINIDTSAYSTGTLTILGLEGPQHWFMNVKAKGAWRSPTRLQVELSRD